MSRDAAIIDRDEDSELAARAIDDAIGAALQAKPELRRDLRALFAIVTKAYPFGHRKPRLLEIWTREMAFARAKFADSPLPDASYLDRPCSECGAQSGQPCRSTGELDNLAPEFMAANGQAPVLRGNQAPGRIPQALKESVMHECRKGQDAALRELVAKAADR